MRIDYILFILSFYHFVLIYSFKLNFKREMSANRKTPLIIEDNTEIGLDFYYTPEHYNDCLTSILIPHGTIIDRVEKLAYDIIRDYDGKTIHLLCVLKGNYFIIHIN